MPNREEQFLAERIFQGDKTVFSFVFTHYYADLVIFANAFLKDQETSEELVQEVFVHLWENRQQIAVYNSLKSYLLKATQNKCIDRIRHSKIKEKYRQRIYNHPLLFENDTENYVLHSELTVNLEKALNRLPDNVHQVFCLNRFEGFTYAEIAEKLRVSVRTIEVRISKALVILREELKDFLISVIIILWLTS